MYAHRIKKTGSQADTAGDERVIAKKSLGQNFLTSPTIPRFMCEAAKLSPGEHVIEIGPGTGVLTRELLARGVVVTAIETDRRMLTILEETFAQAIKSKQLTIVYGDIRTIPLASIVPATPYKVVANIPYYLSGYLLRRTLETSPPPTTLVFLMQKELVERIARAKKSSLASLSVAVFGTPKYEKTVKRGHFSPSPMVDSAILSITNITHEALPTTHARKQFFTLLHLGFQNKRKQLAGTLLPVIPRSVTTAFLATQALPPTSRAEDLSINHWLAFYHTVHTYL